MSTTEALNRTLLLMRDHLDPGVSDDALVRALTGTRVMLVAYEANLSSPAAQSALVTAALLTARFGARVYLDIPDVDRRGPQPPLSGRRLASGLLRVGADLVRGRSAENSAGDWSDLAQRTRKWAMLARCSGRMTAVGE